MLSSLIPRSAVTFAALLVAYGVSGLVATALLGPSPAWFLVLGADFILVIFCTLLARMAAESRDKEASIEALGVAIGTVAQLGTHGLQFFLQVVAGQTHAGTDSVVGATIHAHWPLHADAIYLVVLCIACVLCAAVAAFGAIYARHSQQHRLALGVAILLLVGSTLFLLPWLGVATPHRPSASLLNALTALAVITALLWGSNVMLRSLMVAVRVAGQATWALLQVAFGAALVSAVILALYGIVSFFIHVAGPLFDMLRVLATALAWFVGAAVLLVVVAMLARAVAGLLGRAMERVARMSQHGRMLALAGCALLGVGILFFAGRDGSRPQPPPPVRVVFEEVPIACAGFRWEYGETDRISAPAANCLAYADADILVAVGSASPPGGPDTEPERALQRGRALADAIISHFDSERQNPRVLVLNRGIESPAVADDTRLGPHLAVLAGTVTPRGAQLDDATLQRDLGSYLRDQESGSSYSHCDLYALTALTLLLHLDCNSPDRRD